MPTSFPQRRQKLADLICEDIKQKIVMENLSPGDRLPNEKALMERYECAKGTIREALRVLEKVGFEFVGYIERMQRNHYLLAREAWERSA